MAEFFDEARFRAQVDKGIARARTVLTNEKRPQYPADVPHKYEDKFWLAEFLTKTALVAQLQCLEQLGLNPKTLRQIKEWSRERSVTLRLKAEERCKFLREETREEEAPTKHVRDYGVGKIVDKVVTTIHEWFWDFTVDYELFVYVGNEPTDKVVLQGRQGKFEVKTTVKEPPYPEIKVRDGVDVNFTWLLQRINDDQLFQFSIDRNSKECHTPRRNEQVEEAIVHFDAFAKWCGRVNHYFRNDLFPVQQSHGLDLSTINANTVFVPVLPLFEERHGQVVAAEGAQALALVSAVPMTQEQSTVLLQGSDLNRFLDEQKRSLAEKCSEMAKVFPDGGKLITVAEANICVTVLHAQGITQHYFDGVNYIEDMLRKQIIAAIGKEVTPVDFANYMVYHNRKVFREEYQPRAFCYAVRRPDHYPEGILSLEGQLADGSMADPIQTIVSRAEQTSPMFFPISASAKVAFTGETYLHGYIGHQFAGDSAVRLSLNARARQFSSFLVLVGRIGGPSLFDPQFGIIVQNKDEVNIPLDLETIPTPKEFRDAIESLSPEQQRFATAFRAMQLSSTLFGVCVLQLKPQLEKVLNLGYDGLTKEIRLTQDLLQLFIEFQIPPDLLSFGGVQGSSDEQRLLGVKENVKAIQNVIEKAKQKEIEDARQEAELRAMEQNLIPVPSPPPGGGGGGPVPRRMSAAAAPRFSMAVASSAPSPSAPPPLPSAVSAPPPPPPPSSAPVATPAATAPEPAKPVEPAKPSTAFDSGATVSKGIDYTKIPQELDAKFEQLDEDSALRPTILNVGKVWSKRSKKALLADFTSSSLSPTEQKLEKNTCFDLLDALTKSGCVPIEGATLHVVIASTHCFGNSIMNTLIKDNVNPIEKVERSQLIVATTVHRRDAKDLLKPSEIERVKTNAAPKLFLEDK